MNKYKKNLEVNGNYVYSYNTHVATIENESLIQLGHWGVTTQKHINYVANVKELKIIYRPKAKKEEPKDNSLGILKAFMLMTNMEKDLTEEENINRKARLLFATNGIIKPENWDNLSLEQKKERIKKAEKFI